MNDWDNLDNFPSDDDDNESFDWLNEDSNTDDFSDDADDLGWLTGDDDDTDDSASTTDDGGGLDLPDWLSDMDVPEVDDDAVRAVRDDTFGDENDADNAVSDDGWGPDFDDDDASAEDEDVDWLASVGDDTDDEVDDFLFGTSDDTGDEVDDFLFGTSDDASAEDEEADWLASVGDDADDEVDDFLFGTSDDTGDEVDDFLFGTSDDASTEDEEADNFLFGTSDIGASDDDSDDDFGEWGDLGDDFGDLAEEDLSEVVASSDLGWDLNDLDEIDSFEPVAEVDDDLGVPDWLVGDDEPEPIEASASQDNDIGVPDWLMGDDEPEPIEASASQDDDIGVPDWLVDSDEPEPVEAVAQADDDLFGLLDDVEDEPVASTDDDDLLNLLGDFDDGDSEDLGDLLSSLDIDDDDGDLDDLLSALGGDDSDDVGIDDLFAELDGTSSASVDDDLADLFGDDDSADDLDFFETVAETESDLDFGDDSADDPDFFETVAETETDDDADDYLADLFGEDDSADDLDFLEPVAETESDLDFGDDSVDDPDFLETVAETETDDDADDYLADLFGEDDSADDLDFLEPVAETESESDTGSDGDDELDEYDLLNELAKRQTSELDFMDGVSREPLDDEPADVPMPIDDDELAILNQLSQQRTSDLDFMDGVSREPLDDEPSDEPMALDDDEFAALNELAKKQTSELDFMDGVSREPLDDEPASFDDDDEFAILNELAKKQTSELDFMDGVNRMQDRIQTGALNLDDLSEEERALIEKLGTMTSEQETVSDPTEDVMEVPQLNQDELEILNRLSKSDTSELEFMDGISRDETGEFFEVDDRADESDFFDDYETADDIQDWFDAQDDEGDQKPATGSLAYLDRIEQPSVDDDPDWLDQISGLDTDMLNDAAGSRDVKPAGVDLDALIDSFDVEDDDFGSGDDDIIAPAADLDAIFSEMDEEQRSQLPSDLPEDALPEWLQEIAKGKDAASVAALIRQRRDRSIDDLDDRLLDLRERGLELSSETSDAVENRQRLAKVVPNVDEALTPARITTSEFAAISTEPQISEEQVARAEMLQGIVGSSLGTATAEGLQEDTRGQRLRDGLLRRVDRVLIALLLVIAVVAPFAYSGFGELGGLPAGAFPEDSAEFAAFTLIENIDSRVPVLFAVEYGATGARELDTATRSLLEHVITNGGVPIVVSSDAIGLLRTESILLDILGEDSRNRDFFVAGLLPGGNIGLRDFVSNLSVILRSDLRGNFIDPDINSLDDFAAIVLISESGEAVRNWMEQVAPMTTTDIVVVTGQAARPLAVPYVSSAENAIALLTSYEDAFTYQQMSLAIYNPSDTPAPTNTPMATSTDLPTLEPTNIPSEAPTQAPTDEPTDEPTEVIDETEAVDAQVVDDTETEEAVDVEADETDVTEEPSNTPIPTLTQRPTNTATALPTNTAVPTITAVPSSTPTEAPQLIQVAVVSSESAANIRDGQGTGFGIVESVNPGTQLAVVSISDNEDWVEVVLSDGETGWVANILVNIIELPLEEFDGVTADGVESAGNSVLIGTVISDFRANIRAGAGENFDIVAGLDPGTRVRVIDESVDGDWYNIVLPNGGEAWIASFLLDVEEIPASDWDGASKNGFYPIYFSRPPVRVAQEGTPSADTIVIGTNNSGIVAPVFVNETDTTTIADLANGDEVIVIEQGEPRSQVLLDDGQVGFVETRLIVIEERLRSEVDFAPTATPTLTVTPTFTPSPVPPQITPSPLIDPVTRSSSRSLGLAMAILVIGLGNIFWIFRWLGRREQ